MRLFKLILAFLVMGIAVSPQTAKAQSGSAYTFPVIAGDSLATADTVFKKISISAGYNALGIGVSLKKGTGTLDGKLYVWTAIGANNSNYVLTDSATITAVPTAALISNGGYTYTALVKISAPAGSSYIAFVTQTGSLTATPTLFSYTARKYDR